MLKNPQVEGHWHTMVEGFSTSALEFYALVRATIARREIPGLSISEVEWKESGLGSGKRVYLRLSREHLNYDICAAPFGTGYFFSTWLALIPQVLLDVLVLLGIVVFGMVALGGGFFLALMGLSLTARGAEVGILLVPLGFFGAPLVFLGVLFGAGFLIRFGKTDFEPTVLSMPVTGLLYEFFFRPATYFNEDTALMFRESVHQAVIEAIDQVTAAHGVRGLSEEARRMPSLKP